MLFYYIYVVSSVTRSDSARNKEILKREGAALEMEVTAGLITLLILAFHRSNNGLLAMILVYKYLVQRTLKVIDTMSYL